MKELKIEQYKDKILVIISHTEHYLRGSEIVGWGPTIREINFLSDYFSEIIHIATLHHTSAPLSAEGYSNSNIKFVAMAPFGGPKIIDKLKILGSMFKNIKQISGYTKNADFVQLRLPTGIGAYLLPYFAWFARRDFKFWVKYAGNWAQKNPPIGYAFQRWFLKQKFAHCPVTMNGFWDDQSKHCISFENPCLTENQIEVGKKITQTKSFDIPFNLVFIGRLEEAKGVNRILEACKNMDHVRIAKVDFIGDGKDIETYKQLSKELSIPCHFHGGRGNEFVHECLKEAHFLLIPSTASEGFPKVIAEAACYGVIPIASDVGSIAHYITSDYGFIWKLSESLSFNDVFTNALNSPLEILQNKSQKVPEIAELFSFKSYLNKLIVKEVV